MVNTHIIKQLKAMKLIEMIILEFQNCIDAEDKDFVKICLENSLKLGCFSKKFEDKTLIGIVIVLLRLIHYFKMAICEFLNFLLFQ
jgi:hypothetical protein